MEELSMTSLSSTEESGWTSYIDHFFETDKNKKHYATKSSSSKSSCFSSKKKERFIRKREISNNMESDDDDDSLEDTAISPLTSYPHQQPYALSTFNLDHQKKMHDLLKVTKDMKTEFVSGSIEREELVSGLSLDLDLGLGNRMYNIESTEMKKRRLLFSSACLYGF